MTNKVSLDDVSPVFSIILQKIDIKQRYFYEKSFNFSIVRWYLQKNIFIPQTFGPNTRPSYDVKDATFSFLSQQVPSSAVYPKRK